MFRRRLVSQRPIGVEIFFQFSQFADALLCASDFACDFFPAATACCHNMNWHDCAAMRAAKSSSRARIFPDSDFGFARARIFRWLSISFKVARIFFAGILVNHFNPFRQNSSRSSGFGAAMTVPSGVSFDALHAEFLVGETELEAGLRNFAGWVFKHIAAQNRNKF